MTGVKHLQSMQQYYDSIETPLGFLAIEADDAAVRSVSFQETSPSKRNPSALTNEVVEQLTAYFRGALKDFTVPVQPEGTAFEQGVWNSLITIPYGDTCSYLDIARKLNNRNAIRAVGRANGANPIAIIIPCHRVIGSDGSLTGYGGGLWRKRWLLEHEARIAGTSLF